MNIPNSLKKWLGGTFTLLAGSLMFQDAIAQNGAGSVTSISGTLQVADGTLWTDNAEKLVIRANADMTIGGTYHFSGKNVLTEPNAVIEGTGKLVVADPDGNSSYASMPGGTTTVDGNNNQQYIKVQISHLNPAGITLGDLNDAASTYTNPAGALAAALNVGGNLSLDIDGANVFLNSNNLQFNVSGVISNPSADRMVVTGNSISGHMVKEQSAGSFLYPVGIQALDYTPATLLGAGLYNVSVTDYAASDAATPATMAAYGMNRIWHIYGDPATQMTLQHNASTNGADFQDAHASISQYQGSSIWSSGTAEQIATGIHTSSGTQATSIPSNGEEDHSYYTKISSGALTVRLVSFYVISGDNDHAFLEWSTAGQKDFAGFEIERSNDARSWHKLGYVPTISETGDLPLSYHFNDSTPLSGINYYRLKMVDVDLSYSYSGIRWISFDTQPTLTLYPNPVINQLKIDGLSGTGHSVLVRNTLNQVVIAKQSYSGSLDLSGLQAGIYLITVSNNEGAADTFKIAKK
jgi:hypothetical protein